MAWRVHDSTKRGQRNGYWRVLDTTKIEKHTGHRIQCEYQPTTVSTNEDVWKGQNTAARRWFELQNVLTKARDRHSYNERMPKDSPVSIHITSWRNADTLLLLPTLSLRCTQTKPRGLNRLQRRLPTLSLWFQSKNRSITTLVSTKTTDTGHRELTNQNKLEHWIHVEKKLENKAVMDKEKPRHGYSSKERKYLYGYEHAD